jgi:membrane-bound inhibitor of C-type lysozyme
MKRILVALPVATIIFGAVYGLAASLGVSSGSLGAGNSAVASCQSTTLTVSYATAYSASLPGYAVGVVTASGLDTTAGHCASKAFKVTLVNGSNTSLGEVTGTTPASGTTFTADFTSASVSAAGVTGVHVVITG